MYNKTGVTAPIILDPICNGRIYFRNAFQGQVWVDVTTPWGYIESETWFQEGECRLYTTTNYISPTGYSIIGLFTVKVTNINHVAKTANFEVLSYATTNIGYFTITHDLPTVKKPGDVIDYTINVRNDDQATHQMRYAFASSPDYFPSLRVFSPSLCNDPLPPTTYHNKKCWYDDWLTPPYDCQLINIASGASLIATGPLALSAVGTTEYITLGIFIYIPNLWASGKDEWITPTSLSGGWLYQITLDPCAGKVCIPDTICSGDNRYRAICNPADPAGLCIAGTEIVVPNDLTCNPCIGITCNNICDGLDLWSQKCVNGTCVKDTLIEAHYPDCPSHRIDFHIRPWPWYTPDGAVTDLITKILDIDGTITNFFADIIDYKYVNTEIFRSGNDVIIRINIRQLSLASGMYAMALPLAILKILTLVVLVGLIIIGIGMIYNYLWYLIANPMALNPTLTNKDLTDAGDALIKEQLDHCETVICVDPSLTQDQKATCIKNCHDGILTPWKDYQKKIYPDADHTPLDDATLAIQACYDTYGASEKTTIDYNTYLSCLKIERETNIDKDQDNTLEKYDPDASAGEKEKPGGGLGLILLAGAGILGLTLLSKGGAPSTVVVSPSPQPTIVKEKGPSIIERGYARVKEEVQKRL